MDLSHLVLSQARTITTQGQQIDSLKHQLAWFQRQVFGQKSERFAPEPDPTQMHLGEVFPVPAVIPQITKAVPAHTRRVPKTDLANTGEAVPFFDESRVPVETIMVISTEMKGLKPEQFEVIGEKVSYRLAQRPGSTVVLKYVRPLIKILKTQSIVLLDVRPEGEFAMGHLRGAMNIPLKDLQRKLRSLPRRREVVAYCRGPYCVLAFEAVALLRENGFAARRLDGGFPEFAAAGFPTACGGSN